MQYQLVWMLQLYLPITKRKCHCAVQFGHILLHLFADDSGSLTLIYVVFPPYNDNAAVSCNSHMNMGMCYKFIQTYQDQNKI